MVMIILIIKMFIVPSDVLSTFGSTMSKIAVKDIIPCFVRVTRLHLRQDESQIYKIN